VRENFIGIVLTVCVMRLSFVLICISTVCVIGIVLTVCVNCVLTVCVIGIVLTVCVNCVCYETVCEREFYWYCVNCQCVQVATYNKYHSLNSWTLCHNYRGLDSLKNIAQSPHA